MDKMYADTFQMLASVIRRRDPRARIGAEGSDPGDLEQTVDGLDFWGPYRNLVADETLRNVRPDAVRGIWWGGYIQCTRSGYPLEQWEYLLTGTVNADLWFQCEPGGTLSSFGGDLNFAPYVEKMSISLGRCAFVYEVDSGFVGETDRIEIPSLDVPFKLYSAFEQRQEPPAAEWSNGVVSTSRLRTGSVYRLTPVDPDGKPAAHREEVFVADGRPRPVRFAYSDAEGRWTLVLRDVATGLETRMPALR